MIHLRFSHFYPTKILLKSWSWSQMHWFIKGCKKNASRIWASNMKFNKKLWVELDLKEIEIKDLDQRRGFCELQHFSLREKIFAFMKKGIGSTLHSHPCYNLEVQFDLGPSFLKITPCVVCSCGFPQDDIIVSICRYVYHPWCAWIHFKQNN